MKAPVWRIRHRETGYYVAFLVVQDPDTSPRRALGLVQTPKGYPEEAVQFSRECDARRFADACLKPGVLWDFVRAQTAATWSYGCPPEPFAVGLAALAAALEHELAEEGSQP